MKLLIWLLNLAAAGSAVLVGMSVYPGMLVDLLLPSVLCLGLLMYSSPLWIGMLAVVQVVRIRRAGKKWPGLVLNPIVDHGERPGDADGPRTGETGPGEAADARRRRNARRRVLAPLAIIIGSPFLIWSGVPMRLAFAWSRPAFERFVANAPYSSRYGKGERLGRRLGPYYVDGYAADSRGGVYFRTHSGHDWLAPNIISYGFAYRPNREGCIFGGPHYELFHMSGDWYCFSVADSS